jgi:hypothetical protein
MHDIKSAWERNKLLKVNYSKLQTRKQSRGDEFPNTERSSMNICIP